MSALRADAIEAVEIPFARARAHAAQVEGILTSDEMIRKPHSDLEAMLVGQGMEWARLMLKENLRLRAQLERTTSVVGADGVERASTRDSERHLETLLGNRTGMDATRGQARAAEVRGWEDIERTGGRSGSRSSRRAAAPRRSRGATA